MSEIPNRWMFVDPEPTEKGILLSDRIEAYVKKHQLLIHPNDFKEGNLKAASYSLTLGAKYYFNGNIYELKQGEYLEVPPNSFVVAGIKEKVVLPHWCAARFGLRVAYVYRGLLAGVGPQVDPGFEGYLGCPLHNLTNRPVKIKVGEPFAWIDFTKTSRLADESAFKNPEELLKAASKRDRDRYEGKEWVIPGYLGFECRLYETKRLSFEDSLPGGETIQSSVKGLEDSINSLVKEWPNYQRATTGEIEKFTKVSQKINIAAVAALAAIFTTVLLTIGVEVWMPKAAALAELRQKVEALQHRQEEQRPTTAPLSPTLPSPTQSTPSAPPVPENRKALPAAPPTSK